MRTNLTNILIITALLFVCHASANAQVAVTPTSSTFASEVHPYAKRLSIDTDINTLRNDLFPELSYEWDDILQYSPAAVMVGMKAFGYEQNEMGRDACVGCIFCRHHGWSRKWSQIFREKTAS